MNPRKKRYRFLLVLVGIAVFGACATRTVPPPLPVGVTKEHVQLELAGQTVSVTIFRPKVDQNAPLVVVAHGFTRSKRYMAGWGGGLAGDGFLVAVPTQPALSDHALNASVLAALVEKLRGQRRVALVGFSMGGLTTLLAAAQTRIDAWVGLDPVDMNGTGTIAAKGLNTPSAILRAEPGAWNRYGNAEEIFAALPASKRCIKVLGSSHLDAEWPTDLLGQFACGFVDADRQSAFRKYATTFLKATLLNDPEAKSQMARASSDPAVQLLGP